MESPNESPRVYTRHTRRTARYALIGAEPRDAARVWFVLHGYAQLAPRFLRPFTPVVPPDTCIVAPEGLSRFYVDMPSGDGRHLQRVGATWMTREAREDDIADTLLWLDGVHTDVLRAARSDVSVGVLGFSQGVATASRWVAQGAVTPSAFVAWAGGLAHDVDAAALQRRLATAQVTIVRGSEDALMTEAHCDELHARLVGWQPATARVRFEGGHHLDAGALAPLLDSLGGK